MNRPEIYQRSIDVLSRAYLNGTLRHSNCHACAVGNLVAAAKGLSFTDRCNWEVGYPSWQYIHMVDEISKQQKFWRSVEHKEEGLNEIMATGYNVDETARIELAFELTPEGVNDRMYAGLMAVVDVLDQIHEVDDATITEESKAKFAKVPA